jgi:hypothetical protein
LHIHLSHGNLKNVSKLARLAVHFFLCFIGLFLISAGIRFLAIRLEWARLLTLQPEALQNEIVAAVRWALSFGLYCSIILGLCFTSQEKVFAPLAILLIALLSVGLAYGVSLGLENLESIVAVKIPTRPIGGPGLILANPMRPTGTAVVLLDGPSSYGGARIVVASDRPMLYHETFPGKDASPSVLSLSPIVEESPWVFKSIAIDLKLNAENMQRRYSEGLLPFLIYTGALVILLISFLFIMNFSAWPLANFFLCCLVFRAVLFLENLLNSPGIQDFFNSLLQNYLPLSAVVPLIFCLVGLLVYLYSFLVYLARRKSINEI